MRNLDIVPATSRSRWRPLRTARFGSNHNDLKDCPQFIWQLVEYEHSIHDHGVRTQAVSSARASVHP